MSEVSTQTVYFAEPGPANTERTLQLARQRAQELGIKNIVVATTRGEVGVRAASFFEGFNLVLVTHSTGFPAPDTQELTPENRQAIRDSGAHLLTATHAFGGIGRAVRRKLNTYQVDEVMAYTLRIFGEGMKVCCEVTLMAADAGLIRTDEEAIALGGTGRGVDTAVVLQPAHAQDFFSMCIKEIVCKPRSWEMKVHK